MKLANFLSGIYSNIFGHKTTEDIQKFIDLNRKHWSDFQGDKKNGYLLIDGSKNSAVHIIVALRAVKSIEEHTGCLPIALLDSFSFSSGYWKKIYGSYNIKNFLYFKNHYGNVTLGLRAFFSALSFCLGKKSGDDLLGLKFEDIYVGDLIYDTILRFNVGLYTINKVKLGYFGYIFSAFFRVLVYKKIFEKYDIKYLFPCLTVFLKGILVRVADKNGATVILASRKLMKNYKGLDIREGKYRPRKSEVEALEKSGKIYNDIEEYLRNRLSGNVQELDAMKSYKDKIDYTKDTLCEQLDLDKSKPIVFVMPHVFSDGSHHCPVEKLLFRDYFVWFMETIKCISDIKSANWIVKSHPMAFKYSEVGEVERLVDLHGKNNIRVAPADLNTRCLKDVADAVVTVQGKSGLEFSCFGIPAIVAPGAPYGGFGVAIEPKTKEEYFELLKNISTIPKLNEKQIKKAKLLAGILFVYSRTSDPLFPPKKDVLYSIDNDESSKWKQGCALMENYDRSKDDFYQRIKDLLDLNFYRKYLN